MLDRHIAVDQPELVRNTLLLRHAGPEAFESLDRIQDLESRRKAAAAEGDECRRIRNELSPRIGSLMKLGAEGRVEADSLKEQVRVASERARALEQEQAEVEQGIEDILLRLPNLLLPEVPEGVGDEAALEVLRWGTPRVFDFEPKAHDDLGAELGIIDSDRAARMSGARFTVLRGAGAALERALISFFLDTHVRKHGYTELMVPYIVSRDAMLGTGQLPKFEEDLFKLSKPLNGKDAYLIPTAEVPVTNLHREELLDADQLPIRYCCFTPCFRAEAGSYGRDTKGLIRQHQFHKVELVHITTAESSRQAHETLTGHAESILQALELPYRKVRIAAGDASAAAASQMDLEVWLPSQQRYREISSCSNFLDYQARRMKLRYRAPLENGKTRATFCHTLNGSALAVGRTLVAVLENYQQRDGTVIIPELLRPWMGGLDRITKAG